MSGAQQDAALRGASLAFQNQKPKLPPGDSKPPSTPKNNGALLAATSASRDHSVSRDTSPPRLSRANSTRPSAQRTISRQTTGGSSVQDWGAKSPSDQAAAAAQRLSQFLSSPSSATANSPYLLPPGGRPSADTRSASFIAATLAASRSASPSPNHTGTPGYNAGHNRLASYWETRRGSIGASSVASTASLDLPDTSNIAPTTSLISMFENKKADDKPSKRKDGSPGRALGPTPKLRPPTPERELSPKREDVDRPELKKTAPKPKPKPKPKAKPRAVTPPPQIVRRAATEIVSPEPRRIEQRLKLPPPSPPPTRSTPVSQRTRQDKPIKPQEKPATKTAPPVKSSKPRVTPLVISGSAPTRPRQESTSGSMPRPTTAKSASSDDTFVSASSMQSPRSPSIRSLQDMPLPQADHVVARPSLKPRSSGRPSTPRSASRPITPKPRRPQSARMLSNPSPTRSVFQQPADSSALTLDSLTSAIVAGALASAKHPANPLSRSPPPIPAPRNRHKKISPHHSGRQGMRQTLRQPASKSDDEDARRRKRALEGRKKHTHHEGTRRRWRDEIYEREKKRYEAVWASNRGLFLVAHPSHPSHFQVVELPPAAALREGEDLSEHVANVVVKDIWSRSRLPEDELAEVWDLVDRGRKGMLNKQEFVVGMWLIDQRLRGRKIPARVSSSVWDSVKGVRVPGPGVKAKGK